MINNSFQKFLWQRKSRKRRHSSINIDENQRPIKAASKCELVSDKVRSLKSKGDYNGCENLLREICASNNNDELGQIASYELALLLSQRGNSIDADVYLRKLGYRFKLSQTILCPESRQASTNHKEPNCLYNGDSSHIVAAFDNAISPQLLKSLKTAFSVNSPFWNEHNYPTKDFFSYNTRFFNQKSSNLIEQLVSELLPLVEKSFPEKNINSSLLSIEWWCHKRERDSEFAHQLHFDLDEQLLHSKKRKNTSSTSEIKNLHPIISSVFYLSDHHNLGCPSAPTLVTNQTLSVDSIATEGWLCTPVENRVMFFDGRLLHGVIPYLTPPSFNGVSTESRITLMIGWWGKTFPSNTSSSTSNKSLSPNMQMPNVSNSERGKENSWIKLLKPLDHNYMNSLSHIRPKEATLNYIPGPIWVPVCNDHPQDCVEENVSLPNKKIFSSLVNDDVEFITREELEQLRNSNRIDDEIKNSKLNQISTTLPTTNDVVFVGKWFLKSLTEIRDDVLG